MMGKQSRGKRSKRSNNPYNIATAPPNDGTNTRTVDVAVSQGSWTNAQPQSEQTDATSSRASSQLSFPTMSPTNSFQPAPTVQGYKKIPPSVLTYPAVDISLPRTAKSSDSRMVPDKLGFERLTLKHNASGASLRREYIVPSSLLEMVRQPWEKGDIESEGEKDVATGSKWVIKGSGELKDAEKVRARAEGRSIRLDIMDMASNPEQDVYATKHYKAPTLHSTDQHSPFHALDRGYSSLSSVSSQSSSPRHSYHSPSLSSRLLPNHMSAFEYAIRPFLDNSPTHHGYNPVLSSSTSVSISSSEPSMPANTPSAAQSSWSYRREQLYKAPSPDHGFPEFLKGAKTLENRLHYLTLNIALLRCAVLIQLTKASHDDDINPLNSSGGLRIYSTSRSRSRDRLRSPNAHLDASDFDSDDDDAKTENYEAWSKIHTLAYMIAYPIAQRLEHQGLQARCLYWVGRAEWGLGNWENAKKAFERIILYGATDLSSDEKNWAFWLQKTRARVIGDEALGIDMNVKEDDDSNEERNQEDDGRQNFEEWEWDYITHGVLRTYKAAHRRKHRRIRDRVSSNSRHLPPSSARSLADKYQEHAFSPWDQILGDGEISPSRQNLGDILETEGAEEGTDIENFGLESPHVRRDVQSSGMGR
jgi:hypothetical protein